jgi:V/A-type H+-transporting ATPase subunit E
MEERLEGLLERIQREGVERADAEATRIVAQAKAQAERIVATARTEAEEIRARADADVQAGRERAEKALEQAGRDFLLSLQKSIESVLCESLRETVAEGLTPDVVAEMLVRLADAYAQHDMNESRVDVLLSPEDRESVAELVLRRYRDLVNQGLTLRADERLDRGFKVSFVDDNLYHDFSLPALAEALAPVLKSPLGEIVVRAAAKEA